MLERIKETGDIFMAYSDKEWVLEGAAVNVSIVGFDRSSEVERSLDGHPVSAVNANLTSGVDLTKAFRLKENIGISFMGDTKGGPFDIPEDSALEMLGRPNPHRKSNADVVRPYVNGRDITDRSRRMWIIDFGTDMTVEEAALYEGPFEYVREHVKPERERSRTTIDQWWIHERPRVEMRVALAPLRRYIATSMVAKHRAFVWLPLEALPANVVIVIARDDDYAFGVLHSRPHLVWAAAMGTQLEDRPRYTPTSTFETFPFPWPLNTPDDDLTPEQRAHRDAIADASRELDRLRQGWLKPEGATDEVLKKRTLANLYNDRPTWLAHAHERLDHAVFDAYGWPHDLSDEDLLGRLLALNAERAGGASVAANSTFQG